MHNRVLVLEILEQIYEKKIMKDIRENQDRELLKD
jgi:hypothetical protein